LWISPDPARQFASLYSYAGNGFNPVNAVDPEKGGVSKLDFTLDAASVLIPGSLGMLNKYDVGAKVVERTVNALDVQTTILTEIGKSGKK